GEADVLLHDLLPLLDQVLFEERHEEVELGLRALPVLAAETVERELPDPEPAALLDGRAHADHAARVPFDARQPPLPRPAAVAVHDDGDVRGELLPIVDVRFWVVDWPRSGALHGVLLVGSCIHASKRKPTVMKRSFAPDPARRR